MFGRVVGGLIVLDKMELVAADSKDRPMDKIIMEKVTVLVDPFKEFQERFDRKKMHLAKGKRPAEEDEQTWLGPRINATTSTVGRYIDKRKKGSEANTPDRNKEGGA